MAYKAFDLADKAAVITGGSKTLDR